MCAYVCIYIYIYIYKPSTLQASLNLRVKLTDEGRHARGISADVEALIALLRGRAHYVATIWLNHSPRNNVRNYTQLNHNSIRRRV